MRDLLNKSLEVLVWVATGFNIIVVCFTGAAVVNSAPLWGVGSAMLAGFLFIVFGVTMSFLVAGICFQIMDIRSFTKFMAINHKKGQ
jgi:ABC-type polysaccharide/polyol phosphate export permease